MEWILIMQIMFTTNTGGTGGSVETLKFETREQCEKVADVFLHKMPPPEFYIRGTYKKAQCVDIKES